MNNNKNNFSQLTLLLLCQQQTRKKFEILKKKKKKKKKVGFTNKNRLSKGKTIEMSYKFFSNVFKYFLLLLAILVTTLHPHILN